MWQVSGPGGVSSRTPSAARGDSDWLQSRPGGAMGSEHAARGSPLPGQAGSRLWVSRVSEMTLHMNCNFQTTVTNQIHPFM